MITSRARTVIIPVAAPATFGQPLAPQAFEWPLASVGSVLDYYLDITAPLADIDDTISAWQVESRPSGAGELVVSSLSADDGVLGLLLTPTIGGRFYTNRITVVTAGGLSMPWYVVLPVNSMDTPWPPVAPMSQGYGAPVTWSQGSGASSLDFTQASNSGLIPLI